MASRFGIRVPGDYDLKRDVCSYGYFLLAPNVWNPRERTLARALELSGGTARLTFAQPGGKGHEVRVVSERALGRKEKEEIRRQATRMLRLDDEGVREFHRVDARWKKSGRARLFRSPSFFEDLVKTVTSCNVTWPGTMTMNRRLCEVIAPGFPSAAQLARRRPATLRHRCSVGYRDARLVELARMVVSGEVEAEWFEDAGNSDEAVYEALLALPGIGPYAAANVMQLLGRYSRLPIDTESVRHGRMLLGLRGTPRQIEKALERHYKPFGAHKFRSYWFEMWDWYESTRGKAWTWDPGTTGKTFTAASHGG